MEFTGERVVPGQVDPDLWQEHVSRYEFARQFARGFGRRLQILDAGCGAGYGAALLAEDHEVVGVDASAEAIAWASEKYQAVRFEQGDITALRDFDGSFDLLTAFEVIEHLADAEAFLREARRVLRPGGVLLVSTPNRRFYTEERGFHNPFHTREFDEAEYRDLLGKYFPHCQILEQNHAPAISFALRESVGGHAVLPSAGPSDEAHFFLAICSTQELHSEAFVYLPESGNVLREREQHIHKLEQDVAQFQEQTRRELSERREWAEKLEAELREKGEAISKLQAELEERRGWADRLNRELREKGEYIVQLQSESEERIHERQKEVERLEAEVSERSAWAAELNEEIATARARLLETQADLNEREQKRTAQVADLEHELERREQHRVAAEREMEQARLAQVADLERELQRREQARLAQVADLEAELARRADWAHGLNDRIASLEAALRAESEDLAALRATLWFRAGHTLRFTPPRERARKDPS